LGYQAGYQNDDGSIVTLAGITNSTAIGYYAQVQKSNSFIIGGTQAFQPYVGIGTTTPSWALQIASSTKANLAISDMGAGVNLKHWTFTSQGGFLYIATSTDAYATSTTAALTINSNGYLGVGTSSPYAKLSVTGLAAATNFSAFGTTSTTTLSGGLTVGGGALT
jgi:hypothetical protein